MISVIVPVFNSEKYLGRCLDSIVNQTYSNLEIIIVNDGSTDDSNIIIEKYAKLDKRIKIVNKKNGGLSSARNEGILYSTGRYITFVDSDDWLDVDIYKSARYAIEKFNCDVYDFRARFIIDDSKIIESEETNLEVFKNEEILIEYLEYGQRGVAPYSVCRKVYRRELFDSICFPEGKINEDITTNFLLLSKAEIMISTNKTGYYYWQGGESITRGGFTEQHLDLLDISKHLVILARKTENDYIVQLSEEKLARSYFSLLARIARYGMDDSKLDKKQTVKFLTSNLRKNFLLLMTANIPISRKIMITLLCINYYFLEIPINLYIFFRK